jgi:von Willebrand factor type A domain
VYELVDDPPDPIPAPGMTPVVPPDRSTAPAQGANGPALEPAAANAPGSPAPALSGQPAKPPRARRRPPPSRRWDAPAWAVSILVHLSVLGFLVLVPLSNEIPKALGSLNTSLEEPRLDGEKELVPILAEPSNAPREEAVGSSVPSLSQGLGLGSAAPSATPLIGVGTGAAVAAINGKKDLPGMQVVAQVSGLALLPAAPSRALGGGGMVAGDVTYESGDVGVALDQIAREILRHLEEHKLTVVWLFDESGSMKDDQKAIRERFGKVASDLKLNLDSDRRSENVLTHAVVGFGQDIHYELERPTGDIDAIGRAIERLRVDETGTENVLHAVQDVISHYGRLITKDRRLLIVLTTDESGDDGSYIEEARQIAVNRNVPVYVVGRQALFGYPDLRIPYTDPVTKDTYWPTIRRGPETADVEALQWDGLHDRWDEQPSGFAPYELARLAKDTGGIYFLLPTEEILRLRQREKAYSMSTLKEYVPDYESRLVYLERRQKSPLRRTLYEVIQETKPDGSNKPIFAVRRHFPVVPQPLLEAAMEAGQAATVRLNRLIELEKIVLSLQKDRDREPEKRWQAAYDLMLAQLVVSQIKAYEYRACVQELVDQVRSGKPPVPKRTPGPDLEVFWEFNHAKERKAPASDTDKKYAEADRLLKLVIERHHNTPWADLARDALNRGLSVRRDEWSHSPRYDERSKLVPKY